MYRRALRLAAGASIALTAAASTAPAQSAAPIPPAPVALHDGVATPVWAPPVTVAGAPDSSTAAVGPRLGATSVAVAARPGVPAGDDRAADAPTAQPRSGLQQSQVLMIVGGAAFLAGAIIGDDAGTIIMIGGAAVALYGLYQYLQ
jgi:hypothetical protein